jgi:primary-amine oxidase
MALDRLKQAAAHLTGQSGPAHPFDPLSESEIEQAVAIVRKDHSNLFFNAVTLWEPRKVEMLAWVKDPKTLPRPHRVADVVAIGKGSKVYEGIVDLTDGKLLSWDYTPGVQPLVGTEITIAMFEPNEYSDHHGRSPDCGKRCTERSQSY